MPEMRSLLVALLLVPGVIAGAQPASRPHETDHLTFTTSASAPAKSAKRDLYLDITPKPRMHVYAPGQSGYIAVTLTLDRDARFSAAPAQFPTPESILFVPLNERQLVYSKPFRITQPITLARSRSSGAAVIVKGTLRYQACDDKVCFLPKTVAVEWRITP
jgi:DsbC/DsbD-like thiol-disulfide interchange protein